MGFIEIVRAWIDWVRSGRKNTDNDGSDDERIHDPKWFDTAEYEPRRNTDYEFPDEWGRLDDWEKELWYQSQRHQWHLELQREAGMWEQWTDEVIEEADSVEEAVAMILEKKKNYRIGDDLDD